MTSEIQSLSIVAGTWHPVMYKGEKVGGCANVCPGCIARMTTRPEEYEAFSFPGIDYRHLDIAAQRAQDGHARSVIFTGKKEPTRHPTQVSDILGYFRAKNLLQGAVKEMQTTALDLNEPGLLKEQWLEKWYEQGLDLVSISLVDVDDAKNKEYFRPRSPIQPNLHETIARLQDIGYTVRLAVIGVDGYVDSPSKLEAVADFCREHPYVQLSFRSLRKTEKPDWPAGEKTWEFAKAHELTPEQESQIRDYIKANTSDASGKPVDISEFLAHDGVVFNYRGPGRARKPQNLAIVDCITHKPTEDLKTGWQRQLIYVPNGLILNDWTHASNFALGLGRDAVRWLKERKSEGV